MPTFSLQSIGISIVEISYPFPDIDNIVLFLKVSQKWTPAAIMFVSKQSVSMK